MSKSIFLIIACALLIVCCALNGVQALSAFEGMNVFSQPQRRVSILSKLAPDENVCCFPDKLTLTNQIIEGSLNSTKGYSVKKSIVQVYIDMENIRMREDINENGSEMTIFQTQIGPNVVTHIIKENDCKCFKMPSKLERQCIKKSSQPQQVSILGEEALKMETMSANYAFSSWVLKDTLKREGICWPLSISSTNVHSSLSSNFYDMVDSVNASVFWIPTICPPLDKC